jgi:flagellar protein FliL
MKRLFYSWARQIAAVAIILTSLPSLASEHGGGAAAPAPMEFTVNIGKAGAEMKFLQVEMVFEFANVEASHLLAAIRPKAQHHILLLLTSEDASSLQTTKGKLALQERIVGEMNSLIDETVKTGVKEVMFTKFIMQ